MKKIFFLTLASLLLSTSAMAQKVVIYKGGEAVASYSLADIDKIEFLPGEESLAQEAAGTYECSRQVTLPAMPQMGVLLDDKATVVIEAEGADEVKITLPNCDYTMGDSEFHLPSVAVSGCSVSKNNEGALEINGAFSGEVDGKETSVTFTGSITNSSKWTFSVDMDYGSMPMTLHMDYQQASE